MAKYTEEELQTIAEHFPGMDKTALREAVESWPQEIAHIVHNNPFLNSIGLYWMSDGSVVPTIECPYCGLAVTLEALNDTEFYCRCNEVLTERDYYIEDANEE